MGTTPRRRPLGRRSLAGLEPATLGRDMRALPGPAVSGPLLRAVALRTADVVALVALDVVGVALALYAGLVGHQAVGDGVVLWGLSWDGVAEWLPFVALVVVLVAAKNGLYRRRELRPGGGTAVASVVLAALVVAAFAWLAQDVRVSGATVAIAVAVAVLLVPLLRTSYDVGLWGAAQVLGLRRRVLLCGAPTAVHSVEAALTQTLATPPIDLVDRLEDVHALEAAIERTRPHDVILAHPVGDADLLGALEACRRQRVRLRVVPSAVGVLASHAAYVPGLAVPLFDVTPPVIAGMDWVVKRTFDIALSAALLVLLSPILLVAAALVALTSPGGAFYRDRRVGIGERPFGMLKLRTMYVGAAERQAEMEGLNEAVGALFKIRRDPRITPVGRWLRRLSIDELPQIWNVLRGEMSMVGPRPLPMRDYALLEPWHRKRYLVLPGITGLWQVSGRSDLTFDDLVRLDFYYLENWSIWLDVAILARTPLVVLRGRGAY